MHQIVKIFGLCATLPFLNACETHVFGVRENVWKSMTHAQQQQVIADYGARQKLHQEQEPQRQQIALLGNLASGLLSHQSNHLATKRSHAEQSTTHTHAPIITHTNTPSYNSTQMYQEHTPTARGHRAYSYNRRRAHAATRRPSNLEMQILPATTQNSTHTATQGPSNLEMQILPAATQNSTHTATQRPAYPSNVGVETVSVVNEGPAPVAPPTQNPPSNLGVQILPPTTLP